MIMKLNDDALENVSGGEKRIVSNPNAGRARIRSGPGLNYAEKAKIDNGNAVYTTGITCQSDGYTWYEVDAPFEGWIAGSLIGY